MRDKGQCQRLVLGSEVGSRSSVRVWVSGQRFRMQSGGGSEVKIKE